MILLRVEFCGEENTNMSAVPIYPIQRRLAPSPRSSLNPLPELLCTPSGLALLELQGTINLPQRDPESHASGLQVNGDGASQETSIGRLVFPDYHPATQEPNSTAWTKRVYLYVGKHQRLTGEVKKLPKAIAVIRKRPKEDTEGISNATTKSGEEQTEELEVVEIVKWKILFSQRPEPVGTWNGEA
jgi:chromosome transmission fidelity protein 8